MSDDGQAVTIDCTVLVIGGGFGGAWAALKAAERIPGVVLVDKAYVSRSGASTMSGGVTTAPQPEDDLDQWVEELSVLGGYEADQDWTRALITDQMQRVADLDSWGVPIVKDAAGVIKRIKSRGMLAVRALQYAPRLAMEALRERADAAGARIMDKVEIVELLTSDGLYPTKGRVVGAIGFDVRTGTPYVIRAKRVILATGPLAIKGFHPVDNDTGDGFAMGYRVGGRFVDMEFATGGTFSFVWAGYRFSNYNIAVGHGARLINAAGERFMERYDPVRYERSELNRVVAAFLKEIMDGRGPVYLDLTHVDDDYWTALDRALAGRPSILKSGRIPDPRLHPLPIEPGWSFWNGGKGGLQLDLTCHTSVPGLMAAGGVARNAGVGRHGSAGTPTAWAMVSGARAGVAAAEDALTEDEPELPDGLVDDLLRRMLRPLRDGDLMSMDKLHGEVCDIMGSQMELMCQNEGRIREALVRTRALRDRLDGLRVADVHELVKFHEAKNTLDSFELIYSCMDDRKESRESFYREDYPYTDDGGWLCWHTATRVEDGISFDKQEIPFWRYRFRPPRLATYLSPIAAIMRGEYDPAVHSNVSPRR